MHLALNTFSSVRPNSTATFRQAAVVAPRPILDTDESPFVGARLSQYLRIADLNGISALETEIQRIADLPRSFARDSELDALLLRYVELDGPRAARFVESLSIDRSFVVGMFGAWMVLDRESALAALETSDAHDLVRAVALSLLGNHPDDMERLASLVRAVDRASFESEALVRLGDTDPVSALHSALELADHALRSQTVRRLAGEWSKRDPIAALSHVSAIAEDARLRNQFHLDIVVQWARDDPDRALEYVFDAEGRGLFALGSSAASSLVRALAVRRPHDILLAADKLPSDVRAVARSIALRSIVDRDLDSALAEVQAMATGIEREELSHAVAKSYAQQNAIDALEWAKAMEGDSPGIVGRVISGIAQNDLPQAIEIALAMPGSAGILSRIVSPLAPPFGTPVTMNVDSLRDVANLLAAADAAQQHVMDDLIQAWARLDADAAFAWVLEKGSEVDPKYVKGLAAGFARGDVAVSAEAIDRLPQEWRGTWISEVASVYARTDLEAALTWLSRFQGDAGYDEWIASAAISVAAIEPAAAARMLQTTQQPPQSTAARIASRWALRSPGNAAEWGLRLADPPARSAAVAAAAGTWTVEDPAAARRWVLALQDRELRDSALTSVLAQDIASHGSIDRRVLDAFSSDTERLRALSNAAPAFRMLAANDPDRARALTAAYIEDAGLRVQVESEIDRLRDNSD